MVTTLKGNPWFATTASIAALFILALAVIYSGYKVFLSPVDAVDFKYVWLAGSLWRAGVNPYSPIFLDRAREFFTEGSVPPQWAYPPNFRPLAEAVAFLPFDPSATTWRALLLSGIIGGTYLLFSATRTITSVPIIVLPIALTVALTLSATAMTVAIGQSSAWIFLGYAFFVSGYLRNDRRALCLALILLMLKPTYGVIPACFLLAHPRYFGVIIVSAVLTGLACVWGLWGQDLAATVAAMSAAIAKYKYSYINLAPEMTGLRHLVYVFGLGETSQLLYVTLGSLLALILGVFTQITKLTPRDRIRSIVLLGLVVLVFTPMHTYDGYFVLAIVIPALALSRWETISCLCCLGAVWRSNNIAALTGWKTQVTETFIGSTIESFATLATLVIFVLLVWREAGARAQPR